MSQRPELPQILASRTDEARSAVTHFGGYVKVNVSENGCHHSGAPVS
jgi:hypothetical protein